MELLLTAFPRQHLSTCPHFPARPVTACLSRMPRLVAGPACSGGFPLSPAAVPVPMAQGMRSCPCPSLPSRFKDTTGEDLPDFPLPCLPKRSLNSYLLFFLTKALPLFILLLHEHWAEALGFLMPSEGVQDARNSHSFVS